MTDFDPEAEQINIPFFSDTEAVKFSENPAFFLF